MAEDEDYDEPDESEAEEADAAGDEDEPEMDMKSTMTQVVDVLKNMNARLENLEKESPPEDDAENVGDVDSGEPEDTIDEPDEDDATEGGENQADDTGDAMTKNVSKGSTPKPAPKNTASGNRVAKAVSDGPFLRKCAKEGDWATIANAAASASRQACGTNPNGTFKAMGDNDGAKRSLAQWIEKNLHGVDHE